MQEARKSHNPAKMWEPTRCGVWTPGR